MRRTTSRTSIVPMAFRLPRVMLVDADLAEGVGQADRAEIAGREDGGGAAEGVPAVAVAADRAAEIARPMIFCSK